MGKLGLTAKLATPKATPAMASRDVDSKIARQQEASDQVQAVAKGIAATKGPVKSGAVRQPARVAPAQIVVRTSAKFRRTVKRWALEEDTSVQELIVTALRELYRAKGLGELSE